MRCNLQGVDVEFSGLLAMRQAHGFAFGKSDMFLLCGMKLPESGDPDGSGRPQLIPEDTVRSPQNQALAIACHRIQHTAVTTCSLTV